MIARCLSLDRISLMALAALTPTDTRFLFRPVSSALLDVLRSLNDDDWQRRTIAGTWVVRDVLAHLVDLTFRRLSFHRDGMMPPPPDEPITSERDFVDFINTINAQWIDASRRFSPRVLTDMFDLGSRDLAAWFESLPLEAPALFGVSWAGEQESEGWFDIGREFTELWHHGEQIRRAVGARRDDDPRYLRAVLEIALRGLPHAYRDVPVTRSASVVLDVSGPSGGLWTLSPEDGRWKLYEGEAAPAAARVRITDDAAWMLLFNALKGDAATDAIVIEGAPELAAPFVQARSVIV